MGFNSGFKGLTGLVVFILVLHKGLIRNFWNATAF